ncbi:MULTISPECIES: GmrSD restriction endonuclease domain-containing protein [Myxococcus]|uniref:DNA-binding domain-containing protein n=1 Tax=Myxococcus virescens TaxID=83456 RepID=A0A511HL40_9BACT|nr:MULTISPECIES: DUF262 domain-containing protein [Myxococcus]WNZ61102.1 DUF262 domain-containing protein [Myxococcus sp. MxC21-1]GEL74104.1 hypothetical protein MVI01_58880 [Myxococcus virescens]SDE91321.1 Putative DNA-binding domain-containing protein [Myxococcus virescens]
MSRTVFTKVDNTLGSLMESIALGRIGLPDIQRPFVWKNAKVRNLFDSMYRGYPVGHLLFWENEAAGSKAIGTDEKQKVPRLLIVDGQQRLTSLYAVVKGVPVVRENYKPEKIEIAFNPLVEKFEVADAAIRQDKAFIPNISILWDKSTDFFELVETYLKDLATVREVTAQERRQIGSTFSKLQNLLSFPFTTLELSSSLDEEQVSEVFVRINSEGKKLNQADFILTLMSVFWDEGRSQLETFCREARTQTAGKPSPFNPYIQPDPDQLLRASVGLGFRRARLKHVYSILRGKDLETGEISAERRDAQFQVLRQAQAQVLSLEHWHGFLRAIQQAGFLNKGMISSENALLFAYTLYLLGKTEYGVEEERLRRSIAQWFFMSALTGRYSGSPESAMEFDLARLRQVKDSDAFVAVLAATCNATLTSDYWTITLPTDLATSAARSPSMFAYFASLNLHAAEVLFSRQKVSEWMDAVVAQSGTTSLERQPLFSKRLLESQGIGDPRETSQIANFTVVEWGENAQLAKRAPEEYVQVLRKPFSSKELERMHYWHALPDGWERMEYREFLQQRRELMAKVIRDAYSLLAGKDGAKPEPVLSTGELIKGGESSSVEFKSTLRVNLHTGQEDPKMVLSVLKTLAAFINTGGGTLLIGVADDGTLVGLGPDKFESEDKMSLRLVELIKDRMGTSHMMYIHPRFDDYQGGRVLAVDCLPGRSPIFVKDGNVERFYVRAGPSSQDLSGARMQAYIQERFRS